MALTGGSESHRIVQWIRLGGGITVLAIALGVLGIPSLSSWLAVLGVGLMTWNLHRLGRTGAA